MNIRQLQKIIIWHTIIGLLLVFSYFFINIFSFEENTPGVYVIPVPVIAER